MPTTTPEDTGLPTMADWAGEEEVWDDEDDTYLEEAAAVRIQAVRRGKLARSEVEQRKSSGNMLPSRALTLELMKSRFSCIAPTADGTGFAATRLDANDLRLGGPLANLTALAHLRYLDLSDNRLLSLDGLEQLPALATLVCRRNRLQGVLDFPAPAGLLKTSLLRHADLSGNKITGAVSLPPVTAANGTVRPVGVEAHTALEVLLLDGNEVRSLRGLSALPQLMRLSVAHNQLVDTAGATGLLRLAELDLSHNALAACEELGGMLGLTRMDLANNQLVVLPDLSALSKLRVADLSHNQLPSAEALAAAIGHGISPQLGTSPLRTLTVENNPLDKARPDLRLELLHLLPELTTLNGVDASGEERSAAHNLHGDDNDELASIRRGYFPDRLGTAELQQLPHLMKLYRAQYTKAFQTGKPIPDHV